MIRTTASTPGPPPPFGRTHDLWAREMKGSARHLAHRTDAWSGARDASRWRGRELQGRRPPVGGGLGRIGGEPRRPDSFDGAVLVAVGSIAAHSHRPDGTPLAIEDEHAARDGNELPARRRGHCALEGGPILQPIADGPRGNSHAESAARLALGDADPQRSAAVIALHGHHLP